MLEPTEMIVQIKRLNPNAEIPEYQTSGAAGFDLHSLYDYPITGTPTLVQTGIAVKIPRGTALLLLPRSGLAIKQESRTTLANSVGLLDEDYVGEIMLGMVSATAGGFPINKGMRVAQGLLIPYIRATFNVVDDLEKTDRGESGFGHTGV